MHSLRAHKNNALSAASSLAWLARHEPLVDFARNLRGFWEARRAAAKAREDYRVLSRDELLARKTGSRVFVFGSGYSLNDIPGDEWQRMAADDSIGFSGSIYLKKIPLTYLLLRAWTETSAGATAWRKDTEEVLSVIEDNPFLEDTAFVFQKGLTALFNNRLIGWRLWNQKRPVYFYLSDKMSPLPHSDLRHGLVHGKSTLCSAISLAAALGYAEIVLVGVDLYDSRYFWLPPDKTLGWCDQEKKLVESACTVRGASAMDTHNTALNGVIEYVGEWGRHLRETRGVRMSVYNPRSLLTRTLPVFSFDGEKHA